MSDTLDQSCNSSRETPAPHTTKADTRIDKNKANPNDFDAILAPVKQDFAAVDVQIQKSLASDVPLIAKINDYLINSGGKRLRPLIALLCGNIQGNTGNPRQHKLATAVEFLHNATLLHDDVVDDSDLRRGRKTTHTLWGNATSILVGDFLISRSLQLLTDLDHMPVLRVFAETTNQIAEGEVLQLIHCKNPDTTLAQYKEVIKRKTAKMFEAAARGAAMLDDCSTEVVEALSSYALHLGNGFQMIDDALDYSGEEAATGKHVGDDAAEGKITLPLLLALQKLPSADQGELRKSLSQPERSQAEVAAIVQSVQESGAVTQTLHMAKTEIELAINSLACTPAGTAQDALIALAKYSLARQH